MRGTVSVPEAVPGRDRPYGPSRQSSASVAPSARGRSAPAGPLGRPVVIAHGITLALAFGVWAYLDRTLWFYGDEWDFLARRGLHGATFSIWAPHNEHWSTLPILLWRVIFSVEHLSTYWPYLVPLLLANVAVVHLVWRRCLREGAHPWVATGVALLMALLGSGAEDLTWAFQIGFVSSLAFGLLAMEVADGPRSDNRRTVIQSAPVRDAVAALLAVAALMCSGVGVATAVALGVVASGRYGWRRTARIVGVPIAVFVVWFFFAGYTGLSKTGDTLGMSVFLKVPTFVVTNLDRDLGRAAGWLAAGPALAVTVLAWLVWRSRSLFRHHPAVLGGALAAIVFYTMAAIGRDRISATLSPSRYAYIGTAFLLPTLALMLSALPVLAQRGHDILGARARHARTRPGGERLRFDVPEGGSLGAEDLPSGGSGYARGRYVGRAVLALVVVMVAVSTAANLVTGIDFARARTVYVRGLKDQIVTSAALLQNQTQMDRAVNEYPVQASGPNAGYLTPSIMAGLYHERLLPRPGAQLMTRTQVRQDESWLDLGPTSRRRFKGRFQLLGAPLGDFATGGARRRSAAGATWANRAGATRAGAIGHGRSNAGWPDGPGACALVLPAVGVDGKPFGRTLQFRLTDRARSGSLWVSLGRAGGRLHVFLAEPWGFAGPRGSGQVRGEMFIISPRAHAWVDDSVPDDDLLLYLGARQTIKLCELAPPSPNARVAPVSTAA